MVHLGRHARDGVVLDRHYTHPASSPSRAALLTGRYAWRTGRQRDLQAQSPRTNARSFNLNLSVCCWHQFCGPRLTDSVQRYQPTGLSPHYPLLPGLLHTAGYTSHAVGKWHLGYCNPAYLPTRSGHDHTFITRSLIVQARV